MAEIIDFRITLPRGTDVSAETEGSYLANYGRIYTSGAGGGSDMDAMVAALGEAGIDRAVLQAEWAAGDYRLMNDAVHRAVADHPDVLTGYVTVNPAADDNMAAVVEHEVRERGARGVNLQPFSYRVLSNDKRFYPLYAKCEELGVPVTIHTSINFANDRPGEVRQWSLSFAGKCPGGFGPNTGHRAHLAGVRRLLCPKFPDVIFRTGQGGSNDATRGPTAPPEPTPSVAPQPYVAGEVALLAADLEPLSFKIVYSMSGVELASDIVLEATLTIVSSPPRMALTVDFGPEGLDFAGFNLETDDGDETIPKLARIVLILDETGSAYACTKLIDPASEGCELTPPEEEDPSTVQDPEAVELPGSVGAAFLQALTLLEKDPLSVIEAAPGRMIAGRAARCFVVFRAEDTEELTSELDGLLCLDRETGIPLLIEGLASGMGAIAAGDTSTSEFGDELFLDGTMTATEIVFSVDDEEFVPPYAIVPSE